MVLLISEEDIPLLSRVESKLLNRNSFYTSALFRRSWMLCLCTFLKFHGLRVPLHFVTIVFQRFAKLEIGCVVWDASMKSLS